MTDSGQFTLPICVTHVVSIENGREKRRKEICKSFEELKKAVRDYKSQEEYRLFSERYRKFPILLFIDLSANAEALRLDEQSWEHNEEWYHASADDDQDLSDKFVGGEREKDLFAKLDEIRKEREQVRLIGLRVNKFRRNTE